MNGDRVLVLNASYEPLNTVGWRRAVVLIVDGTAEIITADKDRYVRSPSVAIAHPLVIRLFSFIKIPRNARIPVSRRGVLLRDGHRCGYCGRRADTIDHITPRSRPGGVHTWHNLVAACLNCNTHKANRTPGEANMPLRVRPYEPRGFGATLLASALRAHESWEPWLSTVDNGQPRRGVRLET